MLRYIIDKCQCHLSLFILSHTIYSEMSFSRVLQQYNSSPNYSWQSVLFLYIPPTTHHHYYTNVAIRRLNEAFSTLNH